MSISPYKEGICHVCRKSGDRTNKPLTWNLCDIHYKEKQAEKTRTQKSIARISEKKKVKEPEAKLRVMMADKSQPELLELAQIVFNKYIRKRDSFDGVFCCIAEDKYFPVEQMDAGHFFPVSTSSALRFDEDNVHGENRQSNCFDPHHLKRYKPNLINKIGQKRFDELEAKSHEIKHWSKVELLEIIQKYKVLSKSRLENVA